MGSVLVEYQEMTQDHRETRVESCSCPGQAGLDNPAALVQLEGPEYFVAPLEAGLDSLLVIFLQEQLLWVVVLQAEEQNLLGGTCRLVGEVSPQVCFQWPPEEDCPSGQPEGLPAEASRQHHSQGCSLY